MPPALSMLITRISIKRSLIKKQLIDDPYDVYIDPLRLADIIVDSEIQLSIITRKGQIIANLHNPDTLLIQKIFNMKEKPQYIDNNMVYYIQKPNIDLIAIEPLSSAYKQFNATIL